MEQYKKLSAKSITTDIHEHVKEIGREFNSGFEELRKYPKSVTIFGSSHSTPMSPHYRDSQELAYRIVKELGYSVVTGGGPGIMAAANLGAQEAQGKSIGFSINLPNEQHTNAFTTSSVHFNYFFVRKAMLTFSAEAFVFFPGGFGTFDEFFSIITLVQTNKIPRIPIILVGKDFWNGLRQFMISHMLEKHHAISHHDLELFTITDDMDKVLEIIKVAPVSKWWQTMA